MSHRSSRPITGDNFKASVSWPGKMTLDEWLKTQPVDQWKESFARDGILVVQNIITPEEVEQYRDIYEKMISGEIDTSNHRHDLGSHVTQKQNKENICQIMWPSIYVKNLREGPFHERAEAVAKVILGDDIAFDFDMMISKFPHTDTPTPWHQDESYWLDMPDKRAASCWCALDHVDVDNGCMWYVPGSHKENLRDHKPVRPGVHVLCCNGSEEEGKPVPLPPGSGTFHHGRMMHYSRGNTTNRNRRAIITNFRPQKMVEFERQNDYDHGQKGLNGLLGKMGQGHQGEEQE